MFRRRKPVAVDDRPVNWQINPYPWYGFESYYTPKELRIGRRQLDSDLARFNGINETELKEDDIPIVKWLLRNGFLRMSMQPDGTVSFYDTGKPYM